MPEPDLEPQTNDDTDDAPAGSQGSSSPPSPAPDAIRPIDGTVPEPPAAASPDVPAGRQPPRNRQERRKLWRENQLMQEHLSSLRDQNRELIEEMRGLRRSYEDGKPKPEDPNLAEMKTIRQKMDAAIARLGKDEGAYAEWQELSEKRERLDGKIAARELFEEYRRNLPRPSQSLPPAAQKFVNDFPFVREPDMRQAVNGRAGHLARIRSLDMDNPRIREATFARLPRGLPRRTEIDLPGGGSNGNGQSRDRLASTSGRGGAPGVGSPDASGLSDADISEAAQIMYPDMPVHQAVAFWKQNVGKHLAAAARR